MGLPLMLRPQLLGPYPAPGKQVGDMMAFDRERWGGRMALWGWKGSGPSLHLTDDQAHPHASPTPPRYLEGSSFMGLMGLTGFMAVKGLKGVMGFTGNSSRGFT